MGHSPALLEKLGEVDAQIAAVDRRMDDLKPLHLTATIAEMREFVVRNIMDLRTLLRGDVHYGRFQFRQCSNGTQSWRGSTWPKPAAPLVRFGS
jgi:hypothetical protein